MTGEPRARRSFADLPTGGGSRCRRCGEVATHRLQVTVRPLSTERKLTPAVANAKSDVCESCAVDVYEVVAKAVKA